MTQRKFLMDGGFQSDSPSIINSDLQITGNLTVDGTQTIVNTTTMSVASNTLLLNDGATGVPTQNAMLSVVRGNEATVEIRWNETAKKWELTNNGVSYTTLGGSSYNDSLAVLAADNAGYALQSWVNSQVAVATSADRQWVTDQSYADAVSVAVAIADKADQLFVVSELASKANTTYVNTQIANVNTQIANVIDAAPGALDTLNELAAALGDDANFASTITTSLTTKADISYVDAQVSPKADTSYVDAQVSPKADTSYVDAQVSTKTDTSYVDAQVSPKADTSYVDAQVSPKADTSYVDAQIALVASSTPSWTAITANATVAAQSKNLVDTTAGAITITLPLNPTIGQEVMLIDGTGQVSTNNITINGNGEKIQGQTEDLIISTNRAAFQVVYFNTANGWVFMEV
jgi:hypothetical protein